MASAKFELGRIVITPGALGALEEAQQNALHFLALHASGRWGDLDREDRAANDRAIAHEGDREQQDRVLSAYQTRLGAKLWVITEWDRSVTTILLPGEY